MTRSSTSRRAVLVAGFMALVYASLAAMGPSCALNHVGLSNHHEHHGSREATPHNALCVWACQAMSDAGLTPEPAASSTSQVVRLVVTSPDQEFPSLSSFLLRSRAPPSVSVVLIG